MAGGECVVPWVNEKRIDGWRMEMKQYLDALGYADGSFRTGKSHGLFFWGLVGWRV